MLKRLLQRVRRAKAAMSLLDQAFISGGSFLSAVVVARSLDQSTFGEYVLANLALLLTIAVQNGFTLQPMVVTGAPLPDPAYRRYLRANVPIQVVFIAFSSLVLGGIAWLWEPLHPVALPLGAAAVFWQGQEFCRRALYTREHVRAALLNNFVNYDLQVAVLLGAAWMGVLTLPLAIWVVAGSSLLAVLLGAWQLRRFATREHDDVWAVARANFRIGRWSGTSTALASASYETYPVILTAIQGLASAAGFGAAKQLLGPVNLLTRPMNNYYLPRATRRLAESGTSGLNRVLLKAALLFTLPYALYLAVAMLIPGLLLRLVYGEPYAPYADVLRVYAIAQLVYYPVFLLEIEVKARLMQRYLLLAEILTALIVYVVGIPLVARFGLMGAVLGLLLSNTVALVYFAGVVGRGRRLARISPDRTQRSDRWPGAPRDDIPSQGRQDSTGRSSGSPGPALAGRWEGSSRR